MQSVNIQLQICKLKQRKVQRKGNKAAIEHKEAKVHEEINVHVKTHKKWKQKGRKTFA